MTPSRLSAALIAPLAVVASGLPAHADTIYLTDGTTLEEVTVVNETLIHVTYRPKGKSTEATETSDKVLRVEFEKKPQMIDEGDTFASEGSLAAALDSYETFVTEILSGENTKDRQKWAPAYAMRRVMDIEASQGDLGAVIAAADKLIAEWPDSRYVPYAYLAKADAQRWLPKQKDAATKTIDKFKGLIDEKGLSNRWRLEADLALVLADTSLVGVAKRDRLIEIGGAAGNEFPIVRNRARVAEGETYIEDESKDFASARKVFQRIADDPKADDATLAGAYTGLGDCLFQEAVGTMKSGGDASATLKEALLDYLRVVVVYKDQSRYVAKAMFSAGRVFDLIESETSKTAARKMYKRLIANFPQSQWATEAKKYL